jgi:imidazolonepropionase-like amidohydrolase
MHKIIPALVACALAAAVVAGQTVPRQAATLFEGARLIVGDGSAPVERSAFLVENGRLARVGTEGAIQAPPGTVRVDLSGKTVMPALVDDHVHLGYRRGLSFSADNYTRENLLDTLSRFSYYGVAAVLEAGTARGNLPFLLRQETLPGARYRTAAQGLAMPNAGPGVPMRDAALGVTTEAEARAYVQRLAAKHVDMIKIWVDDRERTVAKLTPPLYRAIIDEAHRHNLRVMAHIVELADAKDLLRAGLDGFAHGVRDKEVDDELLALLKSRPKVFLTATLWGERRAIYRAKPAWVDEPLLRDTLSPEEIGQLADSFAAAPTEASEQARARARLLMRNIGRLAAAGVTVGLGTDTGGVTGGQYFGLASHIELELLVAAGLTAAQAITAGTRNAADILGLAELGTLTRGKSADFIVLNANPLDAIANTRQISRVYLRGRELDRVALRRSFAAATTR